MPEVSIIIPAYNAETSILETLQSALNQTWQDFEIIIVNDGSTDKTVELVLELKDPRIHLISTPNQGASQARNVGINNVCGKYIAFLDADDIWLPEKIWEQLAALKQSPKSKVAYSWINIIDQNNQVIARGGRSQLCGNVYSHLLVSNFIENGSNLIVERQALLSTGYFNPDLSRSEDRDMWIRLAENYEFTVVPKVHVLYRQSADSLSTNVRKHAKDARRMFALAYRRAPEEFKSLWPISLYNSNLFAAYKAFQDVGNQMACIIGLIYYSKAAWHNPKLLMKGISAKVIAKSLISLVLFPKSLRTWVLIKTNKLLTTSTMMGYAKSVPSRFETSST